jgi:hypothetical protein
VDLDSRSRDVPLFYTNIQHITYADDLRPSKLGVPETSYFHLRTIFDYGLKRL